MNGISYLKKNCIFLNDEKYNIVLKMMKTKIRNLKMREYYSIHKDKMKDYSKAYYQAHKVERKEYGKRYYWKKYKLKSLEGGE